MPEELREGVNQNGAALEESAGAAENPGAESAKAQLFADEGYMTVEIMVEAPKAGGADITLDGLKAFLAGGGVVFGIDEEALAQLAAPLYGQRVVAARGVPAVDGVNGSCTERFSREAEKQFSRREDGTVDYREPGLIRDVKEGAVLCEITLPLPAQHGKNTKGETVKGIDGVKAAIPAGEGTRLSGDGLRLEAATWGNLVFRNGGFTIDKVVRVHNVNYDSGNITFSGDVQINGDVVDGFEVRAGGNITLRGQAGAVLLKAGGDITVEKGLNGTGRAVLEAAHTLKAGFIENCNLLVGEKLVAQTLLNCNVECEGDVDVSGGKGIISGGKVIALGSVKARVVGNDSSTLTSVTMGITPRLLRERQGIADKIEDVSRHIEEMTKNVEYIERLVKNGRPVPPQRVQMLKRAQMLLPISEKKRSQLQQQVDDVDRRMKEVHSATLTAGVIYPPTRVSVGAVSTNIIEKRQNCRVYKNEAGELAFGSV